MSANNKPIKTKIKPHMLMKTYDDNLRKQYGNLLIGIDDSGRGAWSGPLAIGAVILPENCDIPGLNDSKKLNETTRLELTDIIQKLAIAWSVKFIHATDIDTKGITWANTQATKQACTDCLQQIDKSTADIFVADNTMYFPYKPALVIPKGDATSLSVAAASVLAKTLRDNYMKKLAEQYPEYGWDDNKGYVNDFHKDAVKKHGIVNEIHRTSYKIAGINRPQQITLSDVL